MTRTRSCQTNKPSVCLIDEMGNNAAKTNSHVANLNQEEFGNFRAGLVGTGLGDGFNHTGKLLMMKYVVAVNEPDGIAWQQKAEKNK